MEMAVFLDRDGVIIELPTYSFGAESFYLTKKEDIKFIKDSIEAIFLLNKNNIKAIIISNQSAIARGFMTIEQTLGINEEIIKKLKENNVTIDDFFMCPHHPNGTVQPYNIQCYCRKPNPGLILGASEKYNLDLKQCYMIGDRISDILAGKLAGCKTIGVKTGYSCKDNNHEIQPDYYVKNLLEAVNLILIKGEEK